MAKIGRNLLDLAAEIERRANAKADYIAPVGKMEMIVLDDKPALALTNGDVKTFGVNEIATGQIAEYTGIPMAYYRRMQSEDPTLLAANVNRWLHEKKDDRRMLRTLDGKARALLSDRYRALENEDLAEAVLPVLMDMNLMPVSSEVTERRLYMKFVDKRITLDIPTGKFMGDGGHTIFDTISPGLTISNSEVGGGALSIETCVYTWACTNLAMTGTNMRKYHTGARAAISDDVYSLLTDDTRRATDAAVWMQVRDLVKGAFAMAQFEATAQKLGNATKDKIDPTAAVEVVERVGRRFSFNEGERKGILARLIEGADLTRYGLHAAITRASQDDVIVYDRATEMERIGGEIIDLAPGQWKELATA